MNTPSTSSAIAVRKLSHHYHTGDHVTRILDNASLDVAKGRSVALIGRSGSGKSTLLNLISGLEPIVEGEVWIGGQAMSTLSDKQRTLLRGREIGFIYQAFNLIPTLSVNDNIALPLALAGVSTRQQAGHLNDMLQAVGLSGRGEEYPDRLSGGEQQRVAIARALIHKPALILADEPTGNLDAQSGRLVLELLTTLVKEQASALLLVTHSVEVAGKADTLVTLDKGVVTPMSTAQLAESSAW